jgi:uncharacterized phage protein (TIGR01671 family)
MRKYLYRGKPVASSDFNLFKSINTANYIGDYAIGSLIYNASDCKWYICALDVSSADMSDINNLSYRIEVDKDTIDISTGFKDGDGKPIFENDILKIIFEYETATEFGWEYAEVLWQESTASFVLHFIDDEIIPLGEYADDMEFVSVVDTTHRHPNTFEHSKENYYHNIGYSTDGE